MWLAEQKKQADAAVAALFDRCPYEDGSRERDIWTQGAGEAVDAVRAAYRGEVPEKKEVE